MSDRRKELHDLIKEACEEDLPLLSELIARFQHPLDFAVQWVDAASPQTGPAKWRQELILEAHMGARMTHLRRQHAVNTAKRLGIEPEWIEFASGGGSIEDGEMTHHWSEESAFCCVNTFHVKNQEIITFGRAEISSSGSELIYKMRVLTTSAESGIALNVPL